MPSGLAALLDDVAGIAKIAAASVDDVSAAAGKAGAKAIGVVVDDTAVTPSYAVGFTPDRELPIVAKIAAGSIKNKMLFLLPGALLLSAFAPWAVTPILMLGGAYLCFEATEKTLEALGHRIHHDEDVVHTEELALSSQELEKQKVAGAIRTDLILSAEIMAIALADVADQPFAIRAAALAVVGIAITVIVYGAVAFIVKMDDIGLHMAERRSKSAQAMGRALVHAMPVVLDWLTIVGTAAMLWVGGGIIVHGLEQFHVPYVHEMVEGLEHWTARIPVIGGLAGWLAFAIASAAVGFVVGGIIVAALKLMPRKRQAAH
jgi:predicted DNA repair protein MutK